MKTGEETPTGVIDVSVASPSLWDMIRGRSASPTKPIKNQSSSESKPPLPLLSPKSKSNPLSSELSDNQLEIDSKQRLPTPKVDSGVVASPPTQSASSASRNISSEAEAESRPKKSQRSSSVPNRTTLATSRLTELTRDEEENLVRNNDLRHLSVEKMAGHERDGQLLARPTSTGSKRSLSGSRDRGLGITDTDETTTAFETDEANADFDGRTEARRRRSLQPKSSRTRDPSSRKSPLRSLRKRSQEYGSSDNFPPPPKLESFDLSLATSDIIKVLFYFWFHVLDSLTLYNFQRLESSRKRPGAPYLSISHTFSEPLTEFLNCPRVS